MIDPNSDLDERFASTFDKLLEAFSEIGRAAKRTAEELEKLGQQADELSQPALCCCQTLPDCSMYGYECPCTICESRPENEEEIQ